MNLNHTTNKQTGSELSALEWNHLAEDVNELGANLVKVTDITESGGDPKVEVSIDTGVSEFGGAVSTIAPLEFTKKVKKNNYKGTNVTLKSNNNINIEPRESTSGAKGGNISLKPGDDIELYSHHRPDGKEVSVKVLNGSELSGDGTTKIDEYPVELQLNVANITLTTKDKDIYIDEINIDRDTEGKTPTSDAANILNVDCKSDGGKAYLKVRAQAIDLRSESHGGIALQPKGYDGDVTPHMNKIKFEHGGGDGLEFGTFNAEKSSLYTDEYRFKKDGKILLSTRTKQLSDKYDNNDETTHWKYQKQNDDFYDIIYEAGYYNYDPTDAADTSVTWEDLIRLVAYQKSLGKGPFRELELNITEENDLSNEHNPYIRINDGTNINVGEITASDVVRWGDSVSIIIEGLSSAPTIKIFKDLTSEQTLTATLVNGIASATFIVPDTNTSVVSIPISITYN